MSRLIAIDVLARYLGNGVPIWQQIIDLCFQMRRHEEKYTVGS
jgi:hypothetical protein